MSATIIAFSTRPANEQRFALIASNLQRAIPLVPRDQLLGELMADAARLLDKMNDQGMDDWLAKLDAWEDCAQQE